MRLNPREMAAALAKHAIALTVTRDQLIELRDHVIEEIGASDRAIEHLNEAIAVLSEQH